MAFFATCFNETLIMKDLKLNVPKDAVVDVYGSDETSVRVT
jgi:hypothetical protein